MTAVPHEPELHFDATDDAPPANPWDAQPQYVGALLGQRAVVARRFLDLVPDHAITDHLTRWVFELVRSLVEEGRDPHPTAVLRRATSQAARRSLRPDAAPADRDLQRFGPHVIDLFTNALPGIPIADQAHAVLDDAYRSAYRAAGVRMQYLADNRSRTNELGIELVVLYGALADLRRRMAHCAALRAGSPG